MYALHILKTKKKLVKTNKNFSEILLAKFSIKPFIMWVQLKFTALFHVSPLCFVPHWSSYLVAHQSHVKSLSNGCTQVVGPLTKSESPKKGPGNLPLLRSPDQSSELQDYN